MKFNLHDKVRFVVNLGTKEWDQETKEKYDGHLGYEGEIIGVDYSGLPYPYEIKFPKAEKGFFEEDELELVEGVLDADG